MGSGPGWAAGLHGRATKPVGGESRERMSGPFERPGLVPVEGLLNQTYVIDITVSTDRPFSNVPPTVPLPGVTEPLAHDGAGAQQSLREGQ